MLIASRIGTPAEMRVPSVRLNLATDVFSTRSPSTGIFRSSQSIAARPKLVLRMSLTNAKSKNGETMMITHPGMVWLGTVPAIQLLASMSHMVNPGSSTSKSLKMSWNFGMTKYMMPVTMTTAMMMTTTG